MDNLDPAAAPSRLFARRPESAASARRFVRESLDGAAPDVVHTAQLLVSELVTNAVLHARTDVEVSVRASGGKVSVRVSDHRPGLRLVRRECPPYSGTGQGLCVVERLASRHGVENGEDRKTVWFELWPEGPEPPPSGGWESPVPPCDPGETVTLVDVPAALYSTAQQHRHVLLRELALATTSGDRFGVRPEEVAVAHDMNGVISACVTDPLEKQPPDAGVRSLVLSVPADAMPAVLTLRRVLGLAEEAARNEKLLTLPAFPRGRAFHQWLFEQISGQLAGAPPTAWTLVPHEPGAGPLELVPWDVGQVRASRVPTVAADEENRIIAVNGPAADMLGWSADELVGRQLTTLIPEHLRQRHIAAFTSLLLTGQPHIVGRSVPLPALHRDGGVVPVRLFIQIQEAADGRTVFVAQLTPRAATPVHPPRVPGGSRQPAPPEADHSRPPTAPAPSPEPAGAASGTEAGMSTLERLALLAATGSALGDTMDLNEGLRRVGRLLTRQLGDWCVVDLFNEQAQVDRVCVVHRHPGRVLPETYEGRLPPVSKTSRGPLARVLRGAGPLLLTEAPGREEAESPLDAHYRELFERLGGRSAVVTPLRAHREIFGALTVARSRDRPFSDEELSLVDDLVRSLSLGVDNARLYQETRTIAERLQLSMLPAPPDIGHLRLAARYAASSTTAQVGGDWYDCFVVPDGNTALVIGDVSGHNLDAAISMSQLRSMLRGIAIDRQEPPETILRRLDTANLSLCQEATATCLYGLVKGPPEGPWTLEHSSAGHLPPLLTTWQGTTRYLTEGSGLLLGVAPDTPRPTATNLLPAHSTVLLYTDGLIERRDEPLDASMERLRRHTADLAHEPLDVFCDELLIRLGADNTDDIAVLALRPTGPPDRSRPPAAERR
ncbi:SpoIIE family protein phosphatase [Streptomyces lycii]|uniref:SpoIIE family protein phosphatase n=1 Tax=Streptomyces lycii TaxID=2654337 RepID=A0ABQ7FQJ9_9ACTN|nr:SpoIIE family protein phosphatase [Streptomyces lycii]KAF4410675.1 SpoIIE family protein phosphatase [Streptomyces lycii]